MDPHLQNLSVLQVVAIGRFIKSVEARVQLAGRSWEQAIRDVWAEIGEGQDEPDSEGGGI